jgi:hypothetical protein
MVREGPGVKELFDSFLSFVVKESIDVYCLAELHRKVPQGFH